MNTKKRMKRNPKLGIKEKRSRGRDEDKKTEKIKHQNREKK